MIEWIKIAESVPDGNFIQQIKVKSKKLCFVSQDGKLYAVQNDCPHAGGILSGGWCENGQLICPIHRYAYDLQTGRGAKGQGDYIDIYPILENEDGIYVGIKESWWRRLFNQHKPS